MSLIVSFYFWLKYIFKYFICVTKHKNYCKKIQDVIIYLQVVPVKDKIIQMKGRIIMREKNNIRGITLIALVITIIVLLILAGVSIAMLTGQNGILTQAQNAKDKTEYKNAEEKVRLAVMGAMSDDGTLTVEKLRTDMANYGGTIEGETFPVTATVDGKSFTVNANGSVGEIVPAPEGLEVGTEVTYTPSGTYKWEAEYCSST